MAKAKAKNTPKKKSTKKKTKVNTEPSALRVALGKFFQKAGPYIALSCFIIGSSWAASQYATKLPEFSNEFLAVPRTAFMTDLQYVSLQQAVQQAVKEARKQLQGQEDERQEQGEKSPTGPFSSLSRTDLLKFLHREIKQISGIEQLNFVQRVYPQGVELSILWRAPFVRVQSRNAKPVFVDRKAYVMSSDPSMQNRPSDEVLIRGNFKQVPRANRIWRHKGLNEAIDLVAYLRSRPQRLNFKPKFVDVTYENGIVERPFFTIIARKGFAIKWGRYTASDDLSRADSRAKILTNLQRIIADNPDKLNRIKYIDPCFAEGANVFGF